MCLLLSLAFIPYNFSPRISCVLTEHSLSAPYLLPTRRTQELSPDVAAPAADAAFSPNGRFVSCVRDADLFVIDLHSGREARLTQRAGPHVSNGVPEFVAQEEMSRFQGYWWSPGSSHVLYQSTDNAHVDQLYIMDPLRPDQPPSSQPYPRPGRNNAVVTLHIVAVAEPARPHVAVAWDHAAHPYLAAAQWTLLAGPLITVQNRHQTEQLLFRVDAASGACSGLLREEDAAWVNIGGGGSLPVFLPDGKSFLHAAETPQGRALQLMSAADGSLLRVLHDPALVYESLLQVDWRAGVAHVLAAPVASERHIYRVSLGDAGGCERLTGSAGVHTATFAGPRSGPALHVLERSHVAQATSYAVMRGADKVCDVASACEAPLLDVRVQLLTVGDRGFHAAVVYPQDFDEKKSYPVIHHVYGGPHFQSVQNSRNGYLLHQWLANHGFIVTTGDNRGTPSRGRDWERAIKNDLISVPLDDQVEILQAILRDRPYMDGSRVGVFGWSFGGYFSAHAVMQRPDVFHAGIAGAPVCAWEDYDTHYTERYMSLPEDNKAGYDHSNVLTHCAKLRRPLLIAHGTADDNVYFAHALKMSNALFRAGAHHEFLPLSDFTHMVSTNIFFCLDVENEKDCTITQPPDSFF
jgi:dipeptidyl-peptidase-4